MQPVLDHVTDLHIEVGAIQTLGDTGAGVRRIIPILGGSLAGPRLTGTVLAGGADWQVVRPDGVTDLEARYTLKTDDGTLVYVVNRGFRHGPPDVMARISAGEAVAPEAYYFRTTPRFEAAGEAYAWLGRTIFVGLAERRPSAVLIRVFAVL